MKIICIDPGTKLSGLVVVTNNVITLSEKIENHFILKEFEGLTPNTIVLIEKVESRGKILGKTTIETAIWCGKFHQFFRSKKANVFFVERRDVLGTLKCKNDKEVRKYCLNKNIKKENGIKVTADCWQALALYHFWNL